MKRPTQKVHIIYGGKHYAFDAVVKIDHQHQLEIADDAKDMEEKQHVRYAALKPSMITMEVSVSDTVSAEGEPLTVGASTRSASAYKNLYAIQRSREYLTVVTKMHTFTRMMIESFTVIEDMDFQEEMRGTIVFKEMIVGGGGGAAVAAPASPSAQKPPPKQVTKPAENTSVAYDMGLTKSARDGKATIKAN